MPIRINLLAEAQAAEDMRRKDPVKRAILAAVLIVAAVLVWSSTIQVGMFASKSELNRLESGWKEIEKDYLAAVESRRTLIEAQEKLSALQELTTNRFLWGTTLNAFQHTLDDIDDVQVLRLKTEQSYTIAEEARKADGHPGGKVSTSTERIALTIDGIDSSSQPGGKINKFKAGIAGEPYFQAHLHKTNGVTLLSFSPPQTEGNRQLVKFSLQCLFPEKVR